MTSRARILPPFRPFIALLLAMSLSLPALGRTEPSGVTPPFILTADEVHYDDANGVLTASGTVKVSHNGHILMADALYFHQATGRVTAVGNVSLRQPDGVTLLAERFEMDQDMQGGAGELVRLFTAEQAQIVARHATRMRDSGRTHLNQVTYSSCRICETTPERPPIWQLKAERVIHDPQNQTFKYRHVRLEMFGAPILYSPWFQHADSFKSRQAGLLTPQYGQSNNVGFYYMQPLFIPLAQDKETTLSPIVTGKHGVVFSGAYRQRFNNGLLNASGSLVVTDRLKLSDDAAIEQRNTERGHIRIDGRFDLDQNWRWGFDLDQASDKNYLSEFDFFGDPGNMLTSKAYAEYFEDRDYAAVSAYSFQDLRLDEELDSPPLILPLGEATLFSAPDVYGGRWRFDSNFRALRQDEVSKSERLSLKVGYDLPLTAASGYVTTLSGSVRGDLYSVRHEEPADALSRPLSDGPTGRFYPQFAVDWRYPFFRVTEYGGQTIEPVLAFYAAPRGSNPPDIRNDDSALSEQDDTNLLSRDRLPGLDRVEGGLRGAYALKAGHYFSATRKIELLAGQSYRLTKDQDMEAETAIESGRSDYFGRIHITLGPHASADYRFRVDDETFDLLRSETGFALAWSRWTLGGAHTLINKRNLPDGAASLNEIESISQVRLDLGVGITNNWSLKLSTTRNLGHYDAGPPGSIENGFMIAYDDECIGFSGGFTRSYVTKTGERTNDSYKLRLVFKTLADSYL